MHSAIDTTAVSNDPTITTLFGPRKSGRAISPPFLGSAGRSLGRFVGRALVFLSMFLFLLSGYLAFAHYWIQTQWTKTEATVLSGEIRKRSSGSTTGSRSTGTSSHFYYFHCTVSYPVAGEILRAELDSPGSPYRIDAQVWGGSWSPGQHIGIRYKPTNPTKIRMVDNPAEATAMGLVTSSVLFLSSRHTADPVIAVRPSGFPIISLSPSSPREFPLGNVRWQS